MTYDTALVPTGKGRSPELYDLKKIWNPTWFQGNRKKKDYFEGWYVKMATADRMHTLAFIPGISVSPVDPHAFIQVINGKTGQTWYYRFHINDFRYSRKGFDVQIANNYLSAQRLVVDLGDRENGFSGELHFSGLTPYRASLLRPGIMGWYRYAPYMECYHGVVSLDHTVNGSLKADGRSIHFENGRGYIEKDWGRSMPRSWIWMQTNHFDGPGTSFMLSVARVPWRGKAFTGFLGFFLHDGRRYDFATYTGAKISTLENTESSIRILIRSKTFALEVRGEKGEDGALKAPVGGSMQRVIHESVDASLFVRLADKYGRTVFEGEGTNAGLELVGDILLLKP